MIKLEKSVLGYSTLHLRHHGSSAFGRVWVVEDRCFTNLICFVFTPIVSTMIEHFYYVFNLLEDLFSTASSLIYLKSAWFQVWRPKVPRLSLLKYSFKSSSLKTLNLCKIVLIDVITNTNFKVYSLFSLGRLPRHESSHLPMWKVFREDREVWKSWDEFYLGSVVKPIIPRPFYFS